MGLYVCRFQVDYENGTMDRRIMVYNAADTDQARWFPTAYDLLTEGKRGVGVGKIKEVSITSRDIGFAIPLPDPNTLPEPKKKNIDKIYRKCEKIVLGSKYTRLEDFLFPG